MIKLNTPYTIENGDTVIFTEEKKDTIIATSFISVFIASIIFFYFSYKAVVTYLIHKELYGDGMDVLVSLRAALAGVMLLLIVFLLKNKQKEPKKQSL